MNNDKYSSLLSSCILCPRRCSIDRISGERGYCGQNACLKLARAALHFWEEPCISGKNGSGAVFFSGCNMLCVFCQNYDIARGRVSKEISIERLSDIFMELEEKGAENINLITGTHFIPHIVIALENAKSRGLKLPVVWNSGGYEEVFALKLLDGLIDIYMPDVKYYSGDISRKYSSCKDYFERAALSLEEMYRQAGKLKYDGREMMLKGVLIRHLVLPGHTADSKHILRYIYEKYKDDVKLSIMRQYTPLREDLPDELSRPLDEDEYERVIDFAYKIGIKNAYIQEAGAAKESFIPKFDFEGV